MRESPAEPAETVSRGPFRALVPGVALHQENYEQALCLAGWTSTFIPYFRRDSERGVLTKERAIELLGCLFVKLSEFVPLFSDYLAPFLPAVPSQPGHHFRRPNSRR